MSRVYVAVCGGSRATTEEEADAEEVGRLLADAGAIVVTGGLGGVMAAAAKGASEAGGVALGLLPGGVRSESNPHNTIVVPTGLGEARNALIVRTGDVLIAIGGEFGTLSEIGLAFRLGKPIVGLRTWELTRRGLDVPMLLADSAADAVRLALEATKRG